MVENLLVHAGIGSELQVSYATLEVRFL